MAEIRHHAQRYEITRAVDAVVAPEFDTSAIVYLASKFPGDVNNASAFTVLAKMKCLQKVGLKDLGRHTMVWKKIFNPHPQKCSKCPYWKEKGREGVRCARVANLNKP